MSRLYHQKLDPPVAFRGTIWPARLLRLLGCGLIVAGFTGATPAFAAPARIAKEPAGSLHREEFTGIFAQIEQSEYEIHWQQELGAYMAPNRAHNLRFIFRNDGLTVMPRKSSDSGPAWTATLRLNSYGRTGFGDKGIGNGSWLIKKNSSKLHGDGFTISYTNDKEGLRQEFLIDKKPRGTGPLRLDFVVELNGLNANVDTSRNIVHFTMENDKSVMQYRDLKVLDANGRLLAARMDAVDSGHFAIIIDDAEARYPVLVDPSLISDGSITDSGGRLFGYSVAYINYNQNTFDDGVHPPYTGPNYGGLLVGVPHFDSGSHDEAGEVLFYYPDGGSLPASPT